MLSSNKKPALRRVIVFQKLYIALSSASISRDRFLSPSRCCGVNTSVFDSCSSLSTTDWRELFKRVSIRWTLFRSRVKSSIAIAADERAPSALRFLTLTVAFEFSPRLRGRCFFLGLRLINAGVYPSSLVLDWNTL
jgi:hypothetical protein